MSIPIGPDQASAAMPPSVCRLQAPKGLSSSSWAVIYAAEQRLATAERLGDRPFIVGAAKELVEAVAKAVVIARRGSVGAGIRFGQLITEAHRALERQPGEGLATDDPTRQLAQATKQLASQLGLMRNELGTGHSGSTLPAVFDESLELAVTASVLWSRWALRRVAHTIAGDLEPLIADLENATWHRGELAARLLAAGLSELQPADARRLGAAVGQRAGPSSGTFVVFDDGVGRCMASDDVLLWPAAYREGVVLGMLLDREGYLSAVPDLMAKIVALVNVVPDPASSLQSVVDGLDTAPLVPVLHRDPGARGAIVSALDEAGRALPEAAQAPWRALRLRFEAPGSPM